MSEPQPPGPHENSPPPLGAPPPPVGPPPLSASSQSTPAGQPSWRRRAVLVAGAAIGAAGLIIGAVALVSSSSTRSDADAAAAKADQISSEITDLESERDEAQRQDNDLGAQRPTVDHTGCDYHSSIKNSTSAYIASFDVFNEAIDLSNQGNVQQSEDVLTTRGAEAVEDFRVAVEAQNTALSELQAAVSTLEEEVSDDG